jgi:hypothetical protein
LVHKTSTTKATTNTTAPNECKNNKNQITLKNKKNSCKIKGKQKANQERESHSRSNDKNNIKTIWTEIHTTVYIASTTQYRKPKGDGQQKRKKPTEYEQPQKTWKKQQQIPKQIPKQKRQQKQQHAPHTPRRDAAQFFQFVYGFLFSQEPRHLTDPTPIRQCRQKFAKLVADVPLDRCNGHGPRRDRHELNRNFAANIATQPHKQSN